MKTWLLYTIVAVLLALLLFAGIHVYLESQASSKAPDIFFGVDAAYDNVGSLKARVDEVKSYTNFFIVGSTGITFNETKLDDVCQYIYDSGMSFSIVAHTTRGANITFDQATWARYAEERWGERFWGLYAYDEPGGHQVDNDTEFMAVPHADNYSDAANKFVEKLSSDALVDFIPSSPLMTSDYALYDFDYKAGYDVVLAELAWNHSRPINIALCRGAATVHGKDWGVMITYTYTTPPYLASGTQIYNDLVLAYENGAKYFMVFDYAKDPATNVTYGILQPEHLEAMQKFWEYVKHNPRPDDTSERVTYVLPSDYAYGFRGPNDSIWGLWGPDDLSSKVWNDVNALVEQHGNALDVIYEDALQNHALPYYKAVFWNGTILMH
jgi:hypothetical protein